MQSDSSTGRGQSRSYLAPDSRWPNRPSPDGRVREIDALGLPVPTQSHPYLAQMARFSEGVIHEHRRAAVLAALPPVAGLEEASARRTAASLEAIMIGKDVDIAPLAYSVPVSVLAASMGLGDLSDEIATLVERGEVDRLLPDVAHTSVLFQCRDATASLVLNALAQGLAPEDVAPVLLTFRSGDVTVLLAEAPYGAGAHACPGRAHAIALANGMLSALQEWEPTDIGPPADRPNMCVPQHLLMRHR